MNDWCTCVFAHLIAALYVHRESLDMNKSRANMSLWGMTTALHHTNMIMYISDCELSSYNVMNNW